MRKQEKGMAVRSCSVVEARERLEGGKTRLVDVREYPEYAAAHVAESLLVPLGELRQRPDMAGESGQVLLLCRIGCRAREAAELLERYGGAQPVVVEGGIKAWKQAGYPVRQETGSISLERQVRIAAGGLVLLGLMIPGALPLPYFVGAGLVFAGVTDTCALGLLLAKLPWNRPKRAVACPARQ